MNFDILHTDDIRVEHCDGSRRGVQQVLDACREERRPYLVIKEQGTKSKDISLTTDQTNQNSLDSWFLVPGSSILVPITMLEEEVYKAEICTYLARKTGAHLILLRANDYGSKAIKNTQRIITHIQTIAERTGETITYEERVAKGDSFHIHKELPGLSSTLQVEDRGGLLILLTASREYGLDDWLFGPPEQYVIRHSPVPVMLVNPRADLFSLCD
jgi:nucleotide-binding universal stress UspA family protein